MKSYSRSFKKGNVALEAITVLLVMVVFAIAGLYAYATFSEVNTDIQGSDDISNTSKETTQNLYNVFPSWIDGAFLVIFVLFVLFIVISVFGNYIYMYVIWIEKQWLIIAIVAMNNNFNLIKLYKNGHERIA